MVRIKKNLKNLLASFVVAAALIDLWCGEQRFTIPSVVVSTLLFFGVRYLVRASKRKGGLGSPSATLLPIYAAKSTASGGHGLTGFSMREMKMMMKHIRTDRTSLRIFIFLSINFLFMFVELAYGWYSNSLGLISDAGHMLFDSMALAIGLYASFVAKLKPNQMYTYGYGRYEILSGYTNAVFLLFIGYYIFVESVERLFRPPEITSDALVLVSVLGLMVNMVGLFFFHDHGSHGHSHGPGGGHGHSHGAPAATSHSDHGHAHDGGSCSGDHAPSGLSAKASAAEEAHRNTNLLGIYLHILADALGSVGVIISSLLVQYKGWTSADAICSIIISVMIIASVLPLLKSTLDILNQRTPVYKEAAIRDALYRLTNECDGVLSYREPHFWSFSDSETIGTLHVQVREDADEQRMLQQISDLFKESGVGIANLSIQVEKDKFLATVEPEIKARPCLTGGQM